jgi:hypothetical protein
VNEYATKKKAAPDAAPSLPAAPERDRLVVVTDASPTPAVDTAGPTPVPATNGNGNGASAPAAAANGHGEALEVDGDAEVTEFVVATSRSSAEVLKAPMRRKVG